MKKLISIIKQAGKIAIQEQKKLTVNKKADTSIVTNGDLAVSLFLENELKKLYPDHDIFSEENSKNIPKSKKVIIIDPIDGTESYSRKQNSWSILIGFLENMVSVGGVIYQPSTDTLYYGFKNKGSFIVQNNKKTRLNAQGQGPLKGIISPDKFNESEFLDKLNITEKIPMYSAALKIMEVSKGIADVYPSFRCKCSLWDLVAPVVILEEAGGTIIYERQVVASFENPLIDTKFCVFGKRIPKIFF
jgi:3'-phosphoadenosine 5'-phosphosulfate (PAPS) 3'-phosphatase